MNVRMMQSASRFPNSVGLFETTLELGGAPLYVLVLYLPPDSRGRQMHWSRTDHNLPTMLALYDNAVTEHISAPAAE